MQLKTISSDFTAALPLPAANRGVDIPEGVLQFAREKAIGNYVDEAVRVASETFGAGKVTVAMKRDEYGESYIDINVAVTDDAASEAEKYSTCAEKWSSFIPPTAGGIIQLSTSWA